MEKISWTVRVRSEGVLNAVKRGEEYSIHNENEKTRYWRKHRRI